MNGIQTFVAQAPTAELLLIVVGGSLVLSVLIGGIVYLRRNARPVPAAGAPVEARLAEAVAAYHARVAAPADAVDVSGDDADQAWEAELAERIDELEAAFASLAARLGRVSAMDGDAKEVLEVLTRRRAAPAERPDVPAGTMSEEQRRLLERLRTRTAAGATGARA